MICIYCKNEINENTKFCPFCGSEIRNKVNYNNQVPIYNQNNNQSMYQNNMVPVKPANTKLSLTALGFFVAQFLVGFLTAALANDYNSFSYEIAKLLNTIPYSLIAFILSVISYSKYKDTLAKVLMIIIIVLFVLGILALIFLVIAFIELIRSCA